MKIVQDYWDKYYICFVVQVDLMDAHFDVSPYCTQFEVI